MPDADSSNLGHLPVHRYVVRVGYRDTDQMTFAHHSQYFVWFESARTEWLRARGWSYREMEAAGYMLPVLEANCQFRKAARYDDTLTIETRIEALDRLNLAFAYRVLRDGEAEPLALAITRHIFMSPEGRPRRATPEVIARIVDGVSRS